MIAAIRNRQQNDVSPTSPTIRSATSRFADIFAGATVATPSTDLDGSHGKDTRTEAGPKKYAPAPINLDEALAAFRKEASLTPAQRARRDVIEAMGLTEDRIKDMSPEQRETTEKKIAAEVARRLRVAGAGEQTGAASALSI